MFLLYFEGFLNIADPPKQQTCFQMPMSWLRTNLAKENTANSREEEEDSTHVQRAPVFTIPINTLTSLNQSLIHLHK
jgi:hypothetical protein